MNAPLPNRAAYAAAVATFLPGIEGEELERRCVLSLIRDHAAKAMRSCTDEAYPIYEHVHRLAALNALAPMSLDRLVVLQLALTLLAAQAKDLQDWARG